MNEISNIYESVEHIDNTLKMAGLGKLNPIFDDDPNFEIKDGEIVITYPNESSENWITKVKQHHFLWYIIEGIGLQYRDVVTLGRQPFPSSIGLFQPIDFPIYIKLFFENLQKKYRNCLMFIDDGLPSYFTLIIDTGFNFTKEREEIIRRLSNDFIRGAKNPKIDKKIDELINDKSISFKSMLDVIIELSSVDIETAFSYCLDCGEIIDKNKMFCIKEYPYKNRDNCRNKFRYKQRAGSGSSDLANEEILREKLYKDLQDMIRIRPFSAFEELAGKYPWLYEKRYGRKNKSN